MKKNQNIEIKRLMFYEKNKTLLENLQAVELSEDIIRGALRNVKNAARLKAVDRALFDALEDVIRFSSSERNYIKGIKVPGGVTHESIQTVDELIIAIQQGLKGEEKARLFMGLLKANRTPKNLLDDIAKETVGSQKFIDNYKAFQTEDELRTALKNKGYSDEGVEALIRESQKNTDFITAQKAAAGTSTTPTPKPTPPPKDWKDKLKNLAKTMKWLQILKYAAGIGIPSAVVYYFYKQMNINVEGGTVEPSNHGFPPCIEQKIKNKQAEVVVKDNATINVIIKTSENPQGLVFTPDGKVTDPSTGKTGTYKCK